MVSKKTIGDLLYVYMPVALFDVQQNCKEQ